jgi:hypothetical protein
MPILADIDELRRLKFPPLITSFGFPTAPSASDLISQLNLNLRNRALTPDQKAQRAALPGRTK